MAFEAGFSPELLTYLTNMTEPEPPLQAHIRQQSSPTLEASPMIVGPVEGQFLKFLIAVSQPKRCLEIGTFLGYSALYIASALPADATLTTCEIQENNARKAQQAFDQSPHGAKISLLLGDAHQTVPTLEGLFDCIFLDANQSQYPNFYETCIQKLRPRGWMAVDNALWRGEVLTPETNKYATAIDHLNRKAKDDPRVETVLLPVRDGILLIYKR